MEDDRERCFLIFDLAASGHLGESGAEMERRNTTIVNLNSDSLFSIHIDLKTRFDLDWFPNQSFVTFFSPCRISALEIQVLS